MSCTGLAAAQPEGLCLREVLLASNRDRKVSPLSDPQFEGIVPEEHMRSLSDPQGGPEVCTHCKAAHHASQATRTARAGTCHRQAIVR